MSAVKQIVTTLKLDNKAFNSKSGDSAARMAALGATVASVGASFMALAAHTAGYQDQMIKLSRETGTTSEEFSALNYAATLSNVSMDTLKGGLKKLTKPSEAAKKTMRELGVEMETANGVARSQTEILEQVADGMKDLSDQDKTKAAFLLFEEAGTSMVNMLGEGSDAMKEMRLEAELLGQIVTEKAGKAAEKFQDDMTKAKLAVGGLANSVGESIIEFVNQSGALEDARDFVMDITSWWRNLNDETKEVIIKTAMTAAGIGSVVVAMAGVIKVAGPLKEAVSAALGPFGLTLAAVVALAYAFEKYHDQIINNLEPALDVLEASFSDIAQSAEQVANSFSSELPGSVDDTTEKISTFGTVAMSVFKGVAITVISIVEPIRVVASTIGNLIDVLQIYNKEFDDIENPVDRLAARIQQGKDLNVAIYNLSDSLSKDFTTMTERIGAAVDMDVIVYEVQKSTDKIKKASRAAAQDYKKLKDEVAEPFKPLSLEIDPFKAAIIEALNATKNLDEVEAEIQAKIENFKTQLKAAKTDIEKRRIQARIELLTDQKASVKMNAFINVIAEGAKKVQSLTSAFSSLTNAIADGISYNAQVAARDNEVALAKFNERMEAERQILEARYH